MKHWKRLGAVVLAAVLTVSVTLSSASACTSLFVGSELTENGSTFFGRGEDIGEHYAKIFQVIEAADHAEGEMYEDSSGFSMPWPAHTYRYTYVRDSLEYGENIVDDKGNVVIPAYAQAGINELGVSATATVSTIYNPELDKFDAPTENGICELSIAGVILQEAKSARHGVELLAAILDEYGAGDDYGYYNSILIGDTKEVWNFLIVSSHNYVAVKQPADKVSINPNIVTMGEIDVADKDNVFASEGLISMPLENGLLVSSQYNKDTYKKGDKITKINIRETYGTDDGNGQYTRFWQGVHYLNPAMAAELDISGYDGEEMLHSEELGGPISYLFDTDRKLSTLDTMRFFAARGEGTDYDSNKDDGIWSVGNEHQAEVHLFEVRHDDTLPAELATIEWLAMNRSEYSVFLPFYSALLTGTDDVYHCDWTNNDGENWAYYAPDEDMELFGDVVNNPADLPENSMFWVFAALNDMCDNDREHYGVNVKAFWEEYQTALIEKQAAVDKAMRNLYKADPALAQASATALGKAIARETYSYARQIMEELWAFSQDYEAGKIDKDTVFKPSVMGKLPNYSIAMAFGDVKPNAWYAPNVAYAVENNLMLGKSAAAFDPAVPAYGSQAAVILARLAGAELKDTGDNWYAEALAWAEEKGYSEGLELVNGPITREDLAILLWRFAGAKTVEQDLSSFADADQISEKALEAMKWAVSVKLYEGYQEDATLRPAGQTTRAELAKLLNVLCETVLK